MEWISTKEELPPLGKDVLAYRQGEYLVVWRTHDNYFRETGTAPYLDDVTFWQPLPKPPKIRFQISEIYTDGRYLVSLGNESLLMETMPQLIAWLNTLLEKGVISEGENNKT